MRRIMGACTWRIRLMGACIWGIRSMRRLMKNNGYEKSYGSLHLMNNKYEKTYGEY